MNDIKVDLSVKTGPVVVTVKGTDIKFVSVSLYFNPSVSDSDIRTILLDPKD